MSALYGTVSGDSAKTATRRGFRELTTYAACWQGAIRTTVRFDKNSGETTFEVSIVPWQGSDTTVKRLAHGILA